MDVVTYARRGDHPPAKAGSLRPDPVRPDPESERVAWVDTAKGICIILVVMMHSTLGVGEEVADLLHDRVGALPLVAVDVPAEPHGGFVAGDEGGVPGEHPEVEQPDAGADLARGDGRALGGGPHGVVHLDPRVPQRVPEAFAEPVEAAGRLAAATADHAASRSAPASPPSEH